MTMTTNQKHVLGYTLITLAVLPVLALVIFMCIFCKVFLFLTCLIIFIILFAGLITIGYELINKQPTTKEQLDKEAKLRLKLQKSKDKQRDKQDNNDIKDSLEKYHNGDFKDFKQ